MFNLLRKRFAQLVLSSPYLLHLTYDLDLVSLSLSLNFLIINFKLLNSEYEGL
jgi:hypothetical protein